MLEPVVFDFNGVMVDTEGVEFSVWREFYGACCFRLQVRL